MNLRGNNGMRRFLILTAFLVGAALTTSVAMRAADHRDKRYYDKQARDYHKLTTMRIALIRFMSGSSIATTGSFTGLSLRSSGNTSAGVTNIRTMCCSGLKFGCYRLLDKIPATTELAGAGISSFAEGTVPR